MSDEGERKALAGQEDSPDALIKNAVEVLNDIRAVVVTEGEWSLRTRKFTAASALLAPVVVFFYVFGDDFGGAVWARQLSLLVMAILLIVGPIIDKLRSSRRLIRAVESRIRILREQLPKEDVQRVLKILVGLAEAEGKS